MPDCVFGCCNVIFVLCGVLEGFKPSIDPFQKVMTTNLGVCSHLKLQNASQTPFSKRCQNGKKTKKKR